MSYPGISLMLTQRFSLTASSPANYPSFVAPWQQASLRPACGGTTVTFIPYRVSSTIIPSKQQPVNSAGRNAWRNKGG